MPGGNILHFNGVRIRVVGECALKLEFRGLPDFNNDSESQDLGSLIITADTKRKLDRLANFTSQAARLKISTDTINEYFRINDITIYTKPLWSQYPG